MKTLRFVGYVLILMLCATACSDDDDDNYAESIIGTWQLVHEKGWYEDEDEREEWDDNAESENVYIKFNTDGSGYEEEKGYGKNHFTWTIKGNKLITVDSDYNDEEEVIIKSLSATKLELYSAGEDKEYGEKWAYTDTYQRVQ